MNKTNELEKQTNKAPKIEAELKQQAVNANIGKPSNFYKTYNSESASRITSELFAIIDYCSADPKMPIFESQINSYISALNEMKIKDPIESNLILQLLVTHDLFLKCSYKANTKDQNPERLDEHIKNITKLSRIYTNQLKSYVSYKNQGQQKVKVEHVHISEGGQAVFGNINTEQKHKWEGGVKN